ncbi:MAG: acyltransferase [Labilithrix sp.]|nr:acyltransferase [Labilithrix sp.]MCW5817566.1 acyltransferase [Labilithrix sp.]
MSTRPGTIPHLPALDGLRGLALLGVLFFHSKKLLVGGYLGVDLFFVLSGYLITSLLIAERRAAGRIALGAFWIRRARRLFPALLSLMPAVALYCWLFAQPDELARVRSDALATLAYVANWSGIFAERSYWDLFAAPSPLEHTWSLAIEEQFYVVWPLVALLALKGPQTRPRTVLVIALLGFAASVVTMLVLYTPARTSRVYFGTDTRAAAIFAGIALAAVLPPSTTFSRSAARKLDVLGAIAFVGLAIAWWRLPGESRFLYRGGFWLTELGGLALITCAVAGPKVSVVARVLAFKPLVWVGIISYGLYLWHWPIDVFVTPARFHVSTNVARFMQFASTFAIATVSYFVLEKPIRTRGLPFGRPALVVPAVVALSLFLVVRATHARPIPPRNTAHEPIEPVEATGFAPQLKVMILGDSTANSLGWTLRGVRKPGVAVELRGKDGCTMVYDTCRGDQWRADTDEVRPDVTLVFGGGAFLHPWAAKNGDWVKACHPEWDAQYEQVLMQRLPELVRPKTRVFAVTLPHSRRPWDGEEEDREIDCVNALLRRAAKAVPGVFILELGERVCPHGECPEREPGLEHGVRPDGIHYDMEGTRPVARWVLEQIVSNVAR